MNSLGLSFFSLFIFSGCSSGGFIWDFNGFDIDEARFFDMIEFTEQTANRRLGKKWDLLTKFEDKGLSIFFTKRENFAKDTQLGFYAGPENHLANPMKREIKNTGYEGPKKHFIAVAGDIVCPFLYWVVGHEILHFVDFALLNSDAKPKNWNKDPHFFTDDMFFQTNEENSIEGELFNYSLELCANG